MLEYWVNDAEELIDYINAARLFGYEYFIERKPGNSRSYHIVVWTDKFRAAAAKAAGLE